MALKNLTEIIQENDRDIPSLKIDRFVTYGVVQAALINRCTTISGAKDVKRLLEANGTKHAIVIILKNQQNWFAITSRSCKELPCKTVKVGRRYPSGLVRCYHDGKKYLIHEKFLTAK